MSVFVASSKVYVNGLIWLTSNVNRMSVCSTNPTNVAQAIGTSGSIRIAKTSAATVGAAGSTTNGYTVKVTSAVSLTVQLAGTAKVVVLCAGTSKIAYVTKCTTRAMTTSDTVSIPAWHIRIANPTSS